MMRMMKMQMIMGIKEVMDWCEKWGEYAGICAAHARTSSKLNLTNDDDHSDKKLSSGRWWIMSKRKMHLSQGVRWGWAYCVTLPCPSMSPGLPHSTVHHSRTIGSPYTLHGVLLTASGYTPVHANLYSTENLCGFIENLRMIDRFQNSYKSSQPSFRPFQVRALQMVV